MEEDKKIIGSESNNTQEESNITSLPGFSTQYHQGQAERGKQQLPARISNALSESIIINFDRLKKKYNLDSSNSIIQKAVDEDGKIIKLSFQQKKILLALQAQLSTLIEEPGIKGYIEKLDKGETPKNLVRVFINLEELCKNVFGEEEKGRADKQKTLRNSLKELSDIKQLQIYNVKALDEYGNEIPDARIEHFKPYLSLTGEEARIYVGKKAVIAVEIEFSRIFLERINDRYIKILPSFWEAKTSKGKRIKSDHFISLSALAINLAWSHYYELRKKEKEIKEKGIIDPEKIKDIKEEALTHSPIPFSTLMDAIAGKTEHPQQQARFRNYLWEAMRALIDYGLLTIKSKIDWEKETIILVFNEDYNTPKMKQPSLKGTPWEQYTDPKARKGK